MVIYPGQLSVIEVGFDCIIGTLPFERENPQPIFLTISIHLDFSLAAENDDLSHSVDYSSLIENVKSFILLSQFQLLETLVYRTALFILEKHPSILSTEVKVVKPKAIPNAVGASASIRIDASSKK
ncbi:MAG TPA: dihydroneopterin aldolase [Fibrobacteraceae bacterium]|jgi:dihydroneopterin aldolase|nr:dihydroneopterin aldolase [Fibrobacteraceae bacterium]